MSRELLPRHTSVENNNQLMSSDCEILGLSDAAYIAKSAAELIEIVDENNQILAPTTRKIMRREKLVHRATYAFIRNENNYFYVQKRSTLKDYCPGYFDPCPGGVVGAGESYEDTNRREVSEEMGIVGAEMTHLFTFFFENDIVRCWGDAWETQYDGHLLLQKEEVYVLDRVTARGSAY